MKRNLLILAIILLIGFIYSCDENEQQKPTLTGNVNIGGTMKVGETATANITNSNGTDSKFTYQWTRTGNSGNVSNITDENNKTYTISESDIDHTLGVIISNENTTGTITGTAAEPVQASEVPHSETISIREDVTATIEYMAFADTTPEWLDTLIDVFNRNRAIFATGHYTLTVESDGDAGFVAGAAGSKTATVSAAFLSASDVTAIYVGMRSIAAVWTANVILMNNMIRMA